MQKKTMFNVQVCDDQTMCKRVTTRTRHINENAKRHNVQACDKNM